MTFRDPKPVRQCCCYPYSFVEIKRLADEHNWSTVEQIGDALGCGTGCKMCRPYLARILGTGETAFAVITDAETAPE
jgi:NAD(P)H-nitrite reductase large subunit